MPENSFQHILTKKSSNPFATELQVVRLGQSLVGGVTMLPEQRKQQKRL